MKSFLFQMMKCSLGSVLFTAGIATADQVILYPVQSGVVSDGSCCSPYAYANSSEDGLLITGCFNSTYGCHFRKDYAVWRWDMSGIPEDAKVTGAVMRWYHPSSTFSSWTDIWIDATSNVLSSSYVSSMFSSHDQHFNDVSYWSTSFSFNVNLDAITAAREEGHLAMKVGNGEGADGVYYINSGANRPRITVFYQIPEKPCPADLDGNGVVDASDLGIFLAYWGPKPINGDFNGDGVADSADLGILLAAWGSCP